MSIDTKRQTSTTSPSARPQPLSGSDFFPPGAGWNRTANQDESTHHKLDEKYSSERKQ